MVLLMQKQPNLVDRVDGILVMFCRNPAGCDFHVRETTHMEFRRLNPKHEIICQSCGWDNSLVVTPQNDGDGWYGL